MSSRHVPEYAYNISPKRDEGIQITFYGRLRASLVRPMGRWEWGEGEGRGEGEGDWGGRGGTKGPIGALFDIWCDTLSL